MDRLRILFGYPEPYDCKVARLRRIVIHPVICSECRKAVKNGDIVFTFDHMRGTGEDQVKVGDHTVMNHAQCMVNMLGHDGMYERVPKHQDAVSMTRTEWEEWLAAAEGKETK